MTRVPKPLVQVYRADSGSWMYDCRRCHDVKYDQQWREALRAGVEHATSHANVGFSKERP